MMNNKRGKGSVDVGLMMLMNMMKKKKENKESSKSFTNSNDSTTSGNINSNMMEMMMLSKMFNKKEQNTDANHTSTDMCSNHGMGGDTNSNMMKMMMLSKMFNKKEQNTDANQTLMNMYSNPGMGYGSMMNSGFNPFSNNHCNNPDMMKMMMLSKMFNKKGQNTGTNQALMNMYSNSGMGHGGMMNSDFNPFSNNLYDDPELTGERSSTDPYMEMLNRQMEADQKSALKAKAEKEMAKLMEQYQNQSNQSDTSGDETDAAIKTEVTKEFEELNQSDTLDADQKRVLKAKAENAMARLMETYHAVLDQSDTLDADRKSAIKADLAEQMERRQYELDHFDTFDADQKSALKAEMAERVGKMIEMSNAMKAKVAKSMEEFKERTQNQLNQSNVGISKPDESPYELWGENWHEEDKVDGEIKAFVPQDDPNDGEIINSHFDGEVEENDEDWGIVKYEDGYEEEHAHIFEMLRTDTDEDVGIETGRILPSKESQEEYSKRKLIEEMWKDQELVIEKFFNGKVPEGAYIREIDGVPQYIIPSERIFDGNYKIADTLLYYFKNGQIPPAQASSLPVTVKGKTKTVCLFTSDGVRGDIILPDTEEAIVDIENHIPPKAIVEWRRLKKQAIFDDSGKEINDHVLIMENELVGTANSASITANCYAIASEEIDLPNTEMKPIEYKINDPVGFYVDDVKAVLDKFGADKEIDNISSFIKSVNNCETLHSGVRAYIDEKGTEVINDFLLYSMAINVKVDNFLTDYADLEKHIIENYDESVIEYLRKAQKQLTRAICNAVTGEEVDVLDTIAFEVEVKEIVDDKETTKIVSKDGADYDKDLVVFNNKTQITELPWDFDDLNIQLSKQLSKADPFALLTVDSENPEIYEAIKETALRASNDGEIRKANIVTKDRVTLSIIQSAYDDYSFMLVKRSKR